MVAAIAERKIGQGATCTLLATPAAGSIVVLALTSTVAGDSAGQPTTYAVSGAGGTWTKIHTSAPSAGTTYSSTHDVWVGTGLTGTAISITATQANAVSRTPGFMAWVVTGSSSAGVSASSVFLNAGGTMTGPSDTVPAGGLALNWASFADFGSVTYPASTTPSGWSSAITTGNIQGWVSGRSIDRAASTSAAHQVTATCPSGGQHRMTQIVVAQASVDPTMTLSGTLQQRTASFSISAHTDVTLGGTLQQKTGSFALDVDTSVNEVTLSGQRQRRTAVFALEASHLMALAGVLQPKTGSFTIDGSQAFALAGELQRKTAEFLLAKPPGTDTRNQVGGLHLGGYGVATWEPPVAVPEAFPLMVHNYEKARAFSDVSTISGRPSYAVAEISAPRYRTRILVGGKDISFFRGVPTPPPAYRLIEPLDYGAGTLDLPQVSPAFEQLGVGPLRWLRKDKRVIVQDVDPATNLVVATRYRGFVTDFSVRGNDLTLELGGEVSGTMMDRQPVLYRQVKDLGRWVASAVSQAAPVKFTPRLGPVTGIEVAGRGGTSMSTYISELLALSVHQSGAQWTVGRRANGTWGMWLKDTATIDATIYLDDSRMVADLHQSLAEEPNRIFVTCISPEGRRITFGAYPGLMQGDPPPYPMTDESSFSQGTTNGDTDTGDGITVMLAHLVTMGYLTPLANDGAYDVQVTRALKRLQDDAGLAETGNVNVATWRALFDLSATGFSLANSRILPAAQRPSVKKWNLTSSGAILSRNDAYDPHKPVVDRTINLGAGFTVQQARQYARDILREANTPNWVGTITCHLAAIEGEHNPGDPLTDDMLMRIADLKPGMNVWLPTFDGGTLAHISGKEVPANGGAPVLTVDTRARDTMAAWECILRNRESRRNPARAWLNEHRQSDITKDSFIEFDEVSGVLDDSVRLYAGWNRFEVKAGQAGTLQKIRIHTIDSPTRFAVLVSARAISVGRLNAWNPQPLTELGTKRWDSPALRKQMDARGVIYLAGSAEQPCGLWPGKQTGDDGDLTGDPITGKWEDDAGAGWYTFAEPVLYVSMFVLQDCRIPAGRIMWNQLEAGA